MKNNFQNKIARELYNFSKLFVVISLFSTSAFADSFEINDSSTVARTLDGVLETGTISSEGTLSPTSSNAIGVTNNHITITNNGAITSAGSNSGIRAFSNIQNLTINNNGSIANSVNAQTILVNPDSSGLIINNNGSINSNNESAIYFDEDAVIATINNSGSITSSNDDGLFIDGDSIGLTINNSGSITAQDDGLDISSNARNATIINSGTITAQESGIEFSDVSNLNLTNTGTINAGEEAIRTGNGSIGFTITNKGAIHSSGEQAIELGSSTGSVIINNSGVISSASSSLPVIDLDSAGSSNHTIINTGKIISTGDSKAAILGSSGQQNLTLGQGSEIIGSVNLGGGTDTINVTGNGISTRILTSNVENINIASSVAGTSGSNNIYTVDPTGSAILTQNVNNLNRNIHRVINSRINNVSSKNKSPNSQKATAWGEVFGDSFEVEGKSNNFAYEQDNVGFIGGYEWNVDGSKAGIVLGVGYSDFNTEETSYEGNAQNAFVGIYKHFNLSKLTVLSTNLSTGYQRYDTNRNVVDNINGRQIANAEFDSYFISPSVALEHRFKINENLELRPNASVIYTSAIFDSHSERGTTAANISSESRTAQILNSRIGLTAAMNFNNYEFKIGGGIDSRIIEEEDVNGSISGNSLNYRTNNDENVTRKFITVGLNVFDLNGFTVSANADIIISHDQESQESAFISASYKF